MVSPRLGVTKRLQWVRALVLAACCGIALPAAERRAAPPNIVLIVADDLGYGHLGCYGQKIIRTPHLDRMAAEGMRFTQFYAGSSVCAPSRSVLMTGLHGGHTAVRENATGGVPLADEDVTVAEVLKPAGYATGMFGKWALGAPGSSGVPDRQGFDRYFGYLHQLHAHFYYPEYLWQDDRKYPLEGNDGRSGQYAHDVILAKACDFIRASQGRPFLLYLPVTIPHAELLVPEESLREYAGRFEEKPHRQRVDRPPWYPSDYAPQPQPRAAIAAMISHLDRSVGQLLALLAELGIENETLVVFTSDNGPETGASDPDFFQASGGLRGRKGTLYEGGIRVPLLVRWPGKVRAGTVCEFPGYFADILPTLAEAAGVPAPGGLDGMSLLPAFRDPNRPGVRRGPLFWAQWGWRAVRMDDWKAVVPPSDGRKSPQPGRLELYDLRSDPHESRDRAAEFPEIAARMRAIVEREYTAPRPQIEPPMPPSALGPPGKQFH